MVSINYLKLDQLLKLQRMTESLRIRRLQFVGHKWRRKEEMKTAKVLLWEPNHGVESWGLVESSRDKQVGCDRLSSVLVLFVL